MDRWSCEEEALLECPRFIVGYWSWSFHTVEGVEVVRGRAVLMMEGRRVCDKEEDVGAGQTAAWAAGPRRAEACGVTECSVVTGEKTRLPGVIRSAVCHESCGTLTAPTPGRNRQIPTRVSGVFAWMKREIGR